MSVLQGRSAGVKAEAPLFLAHLSQILRPIVPARSGSPHTAPCLYASSAPLFVFRFLFLDLLRCTHVYSKSLSKVIVPERQLQGLMSIPVDIPQEVVPQLDPWS